MKFSWCFSQPSPTMTKTNLLSSQSPNPASPIKCLGSTAMTAQVKDHRGHVLICCTEQWQCYKTLLDGHDWIARDDAEKVGSFIPCRHAEWCIYIYFSVHCPVKLYHIWLGMNTYIRKPRKRGSWNSRGDQDRGILDNRKTAKTKTTTTCQCWKAGTRTT